MTDALQQRSLYQCALMKNAPFMGNSFYLQCSTLRRLKFSVISICRTSKDVSMVTATGRLQKVHSNKRHG